MPLSYRSKLDEMFDIPRLYISQPALLYVVQPVRLYPILMSILLYGYQQLSKCISQVEQMMVKLETLQEVIEEDDSPPQQLKLFDFY